MKVFCKDCIFGILPIKARSPNREKGRCRRHAPTPMSESIDQEAGTIWPATFDDDWCGEGRMHGDEVTDDMLLDLTPAPRPKIKPRLKETSRNEGQGGFLIGLMI